LQIFLIGNRLHVFKTLANGSNSAALVETSYFQIQTGMCKFESPQGEESRAQPADFSKAYSKPRAFELAANLKCRTLLRSLKAPFLFQSLGFSTENLTNQSEKEEKENDDVTMGFVQQELRSALEENRERDELLTHTEAQYVILREYVVACDAKEPAVCDRSEQGLSLRSL